LLHPFMPHITEELWSVLGLGKDSIQFAPPPERTSLEDVDLTPKRRLVRDIYDTVQAGRNLRTEAKLLSNRKIRFILCTNKKSIAAEIPTITRLLNAEDVTLDPKSQARAGNPVAVTPLGEIFLAVSAANKVGERARLDKDIAKIESELRTVEGKLKNKSFVDRAPTAVVEEHRRRLKDFSEQLGKLRQAREGLM